MVFVITTGIFVWEMSASQNQWKPRAPLQHALSNLDTAKGQGRMPIFGKTWKGKKVTGFATEVDEFNYNNYMIDSKYMIDDI